MPGPTIIGSMSRNFTMLARNECMTFGTTDEIDHIIDIRRLVAAQSQELR